VPPPPRDIRRGALVIITACESVYLVFTIFCDKFKYFTFPERYQLTDIQMDDTPPPPGRFPSFPSFLLPGAVPGFPDLPVLPTSGSGSRFSRSSRPSYFQGRLPSFPSFLLPGAVTVLPVLPSAWSGYRPSRPSYLLERLPFFLRRKNPKFPFSVFNISSSSFRFDISRSLDSIRSWYFFILL